MDSIASIKLKLSAIKAYVVLASTIMLMSEIVSIVCLHEVYSGFVFAAFLLIGMLLPGTALLLAWGWEKKLDWRACAIAYVVGYCFTLFEYFVVMLAGMREYVPWIVFIVAVISVAFILKKRNRGIYTDSDEGQQDQKFILTFMGGMFLASFFAGCCCNLIPPIVDEGQLTNDLTHWCGNIIELTRNMPPKNFYYYVQDFSYHWFSSAQLAFISLSTDIRPIYLGYYFSAIQSVLLRLFAFYLVMQKCTSDIRLQRLGALLMFFSSGLEQVVDVTYLAHSYHASFGVEYGMAIFILFVGLLMIKSEEKKNILRTSILVWICVFILSGEKVSYAIVGLIGLGIMSIGWLIKKEYLKSLLTGLPSLIIFVVEYETIIKLTRFVTNNDVGLDGAVQIIHPIWSTYLAKRLANIQCVTDLIGLPAEPFFIILFILLASPVCFYIVFYSSLMTTKEKKWNLLDISLLGMYLGGFFITIFYTMYGTSNMYFVFASYVVAIIWFIKSKLQWSDRARKILRCAVVLSILGFCWGYLPGGRASLVAYLYKSYSLLVYQKSHVKLDTNYTRDHVDKEDFEAYEWLRKNTSSDCIIMTNRNTKILGAFTERYTNNPLSFKNNIFTMKDDDDRKQILLECHDNGIDYIVAEKKYEENIQSLNESIKFLNSSCEIVYSSDNIIIYMVP